MAVGVDSSLLKRALGWGPAALVLLLGLSGTVVLSNTFEKAAIKQWEDEARQASAWLTGNYLGWLEESYAPLSGMAALYENSETVTEDEYFNAFDALESRASAFFLDAIAIAKPDSTSESGWRVIKTSDPLGELIGGVTISDIPELEIAFRAAIARPGRIVLGAAAESTSTAAISPVVLIVQSPNGPIAVVGLVNHQAIYSGLSEIYVPEGAHLLMEGRFPDERDRGGRVEVLNDLPAVPDFAATTRTISAEAELSMTWGFEPSFSGGPDTSLARAVLWAGAGISILLFFVFVLYGMQAREIRRKVKEATAALEESQEEIRQKSDLVKGVLDSMTQGVAAYDNDLKVVAWNEQFLTVRDYPSDIVFEGQDFENLIRYDVDRQEFGPGDPDEILRERVEIARRFDKHDFERRRPDGSYLEIHGGPLPGGGFVSTYTDITERRLAEAALADKERQLRSALDNMSDGLFVVDKDLRLVICNDQLMEMYSLPREVCQPGTPVERMIRVRAERGEYGDGDVDELVKSRVAGYLMQQNTRLEDHTVDGRTIEVRRSPTHDGGVVLVTSDITMRKAAETAFAEKEAQLRIAMEHMPSGFMVSNRDLNYILVNKRYSELHGFPDDLIKIGGSFRDELLFQAERGDFGPGDPNKLVDEIVVEYEHYSAEVHRRRMPNGKLLEFLVSRTPDGGYVSIATDITESEAEKQRTQALLESAPDAMLAVDEGGTIILANAQAARVFGHAQGELVDHDLEKLLPERYRASHPAFLRGFWAAPSVREMGKGSELVGMRADGSEFPIEVALSPVETASGKLVIAAIRDVTARRAAEEQLAAKMSELNDARKATLNMMEDAEANRQRAESLREQAEAATEAKASFLATMSHEIRTPMNGVVGMIDLLTQTDLDQDQRQMSSTIRDSAFALLTIINDILDFSKIEAGKMELEHIPITVSNVVDGVAETMGPNASRKGIKFISYCDTDIPPQVYGDQVRLRQILFNLLGNAVKFTEQGQVTLRADLVGAIADGKVTVRYSITDQGIGMTEAQLADLFKPFQQAEASTTRRFGGTGLGLSIVRRLVDLMNGEIAVESTPGQGSTFKITITHDVVEGAIKETIRDLEGVRVLSLVPDEEIRQLVMKRYLEPYGASVETVHDPQELVPRTREAFAEGQPFDVITLGFDYDEDQKFELRELFRQDEELKRLRFVVGRPTAGIGTSIELPDTTIVPATPLTQRNLVNAVAVAVGRASPNIRYGTEAEQMSKRQAPSVDQAIANNELILVVEDNKTNQDVIKRQLNLLGYQCEIAEDGALGLEAINTGRYTIVLSDVHMPNMDGFEMTGRVRKAEKGGGKRLPIIAITANALQGEADRCLEAGMDDYLSKPLEMKKLRELLKRWLPHVSTAAASPEPQTLTPPVAPPAPPEQEVEAEQNEQTDDAAKPVDTSALAEIFGDDTETIGEVLLEFVAPAWDIVKEVEDAVSEHSAKGVGAAGHKLKSSSRAVGANALSDLCYVLEKPAKPMIGIRLKRSSRNFAP